MPTRSLRNALFSAATALVALLSLALAPAAVADGDEVKSGSLRLALAGPFAKQLRENGVRMSPKAFPISGGAVNPRTGGGEVELKGRLRFKHGGQKLVYRQLTALLPADGSGGSLKGRGPRRFGLLAKKPTRLFTLRGGKVTRNGFGARISGVKVKFLAGAAKRINRILGLHSLRRARAGSLAVSEQPQTVEVTGGTAVVTPNPDRTAGSGTIASKLSMHCIPFISGNKAILPGVKNDDDVSNPYYTYPVSGGTVSPQGNDGEVELAGGLRLENSRNSGEIDDDCENPPFSPVASLEQTGFKYNLLNSYLSANIVVAGHPAPLGGDRGEGIGSSIDLSNANVSADPDAHAVTITGIVIRINKGGALNLNSVFPQPPSAPFVVGNQFVAGDMNGTATLSLTTR